MRFTLEIRLAGDEGTATDVRRFNITAINPSRALRHGRALFQDWKKRHPSSQAKARLLNAQDVELYEVTE